MNSPCWDWADFAAVVVRIVATPTRPADGAKLAGEILAAVRLTDGATSRATDEASGGGGRAD